MRLSPRNSWRMPCPARTGLARVAMLAAALSLAACSSTPSPAEKLAKRDLSAAGGGVVVDNRPSSGFLQFIPDADDRVWRVPRGSSLSEVLQSWAREAGWRFEHEIDGLYTLRGGTEIRGSFLNAAMQLIALADADPPPRLSIFPPNKTLVLAREFKETD